ncbi:hypothetical protein VOLCADRAFT_93875 [Volvox carteri f. nagariensis]|uniref:F-box protein n=1 Tax=Volvox carteri f. nagariensis TaxID=3068 RepID=D8U3A8_VOLCA|nr:uncharacterized protein VOLCADRAFT_93875 [Volvox carteri f. nagariensis]EFJ45793.1 hypothetical protein VOLCADRAFT_93875 [Volvox carteri f. nagariensis]|eukprot:XP_002953194.1 hypothetical protein VOLCADRAFT_93875 [Volvox carteri f. nagariensis]
MPLAGDCPAPGLARQEVNGHVPIGSVHILVHGLSSRLTRLANFRFQERSLTYSDGVEPPHTWKAVSAYGTRSAELLTAVARLEATKRLTVRALWSYDEARVRGWLQKERKAAVTVLGAVVPRGERGEAAVGSSHLYDLIREAVEDLLEEQPPGGNRERYSLISCFRELPSVTRQYDRQYDRQRSGGVGGGGGGISSTSSSPPAPILELPPEVLEGIMSRLGPLDLARLRATCTALADAGAAGGAVPGVRLTLFPHQGLGKTITALSLVLKTLGQLPAPPPGAHVEWLPSREGRRVGVYNRADGGGAGLGGGSGDRGAVEEEAAEEEGEERRLSSQAAEVMTPNGGDGATGGWRSARSPAAALLTVTTATDTTTAITTPPSSPRTRRQRQRQQQPPPQRSTPKLAGGGAEESPSRNVAVGGSGGGGGGADGELDRRGRRSGGDAAAAAGTSGRKRRGKSQEQPTSASSSQRQKMSREGGGGGNRGRGRGGKAVLTDDDDDSDEEGEEEEGEEEEEEEEEQDSHDSDDDDDDYAPSGKGRGRMCAGQRRRRSAGGGGGGGGRKAVAAAEHRQRQRQSAPSTQRRRPGAVGGNGGGGSDVAEDGSEEEGVVWVQCEQCRVWRRLPSGTLAPEGDDPWFCHMHPLPETASCTAPREEYDSDGEFANAPGFFRPGDQDTAGAGGDGGVGERVRVSNVEYFTSTLRAAAAALGVDAGRELAGMKALSWLVAQEPAALHSHGPGVVVPTEVRHTSIGYDTVFRKLDLVPVGDINGGGGSCRRGRGGGRRAGGGRGGGSSASSFTQHRWRTAPYMVRLLLDIKALAAALAALRSRPDGPIRFYLSAATLVVLPATLIDHWLQQIRTHVARGALRVCVLDRLDPRAAPSPASLAWEYDIVITTFNRLSFGKPNHRTSVLAAGGGSGSHGGWSQVLSQIHWLRVILDEGHLLGASTAITNKLQAACALLAERRWVMTGTPTPATHGSSAAHLQPLLAFLHHEPYGTNAATWQAAVQRPLDACRPEGRRRLMRLLREIMIRASKADLVLLPRLVRKVTLLDFEPQHAKSYNELVEVVRRNLLTSDWCDEAHTESLLSPGQGRWSRQMMNNVWLSCCVAGSTNNVVKEEDLLETLQLLCERLGLPAPPGAPQQPPLSGSGGGSRAAAGGPGSASVSVGGVLSLGPPWLPGDHPLKRVEEGLRYGTECQVCGEFVRQPMVTPCGHLACLDCTASDRERCPLPSCRTPYLMQAVDDAARKKHNKNPKWPVPQELIEWQPVYHQQNAVGEWGEGREMGRCRSGGTWSATWQLTTSSKVRHMLKRLREVGAAPPPPLPPQLQPPAAVAAAAAAAGDHLPEVPQRLLLQQRPPPPPPPLPPPPSSPSCSRQPHLGQSEPGSPPPPPQPQQPAMAPAAAPAVAAVAGVDAGGGPAEVATPAPTPATPLREQLVTGEDVDGGDEGGSAGGGHPDWMSAGGRPPVPLLVAPMSGEAALTAPSRVVVVVPVVVVVVVAVHPHQGPVIGKEKREEALSRFQHDPHCGVLVMDQLGAVGLDLSFVSYVLLMEPLEDVSLEQQVVSRAHRMGARRAVEVETLVMRGSAEEVLLRQLDDRRRRRDWTTPRTAQQPQVLCHKLQQQQQEEEAEEVDLLHNKHCTGGSGGGSGDRGGGWSDVRCPDREGDPRVAEDLEGTVQVDRRALRNQLFLLMQKVRLGGRRGAGSGGNGDGGGGWSGVGASLVSGSSGSGSGLHRLLVQGGRRGEGAAAAAAAGSNSTGGSDAIGLEAISAGSIATGRSAVTAVAAAAVSAADPAAASTTASAASASTITTTTTVANAVTTHIGNGVMAAPGVNVAVAAAGSGGAGPVVTHGFVQQEGVAEEQKAPKRRRVRFAGEEGE